MLGDIIEAQIQQLLQYEDEKASATQRELYHGIGHLFSFFLF
jgi:hypothetical protein